MNLNILLTDVGGVKATTSYGRMGT